MKLGAVVLDTDNPDMLADFYVKLLGWTKVRYDDEWVYVKSDNGEGIPIVLQKDGLYEKPVWPSEKGKQQQMTHLDFYVDVVDKGVKHAISCGARLADAQFDNGWRVLLDPSDHPFCILPNTPPLTP